jgi:hypothetical protein
VKLEGLDQIAAVGTENQPGGRLEIDLPDRARLKRKSLTLPAEIGAAVERRESDRWRTKRSPVSLHPLTFHRALNALVKAKPKPTPAKLESP